MSAKTPRHETDHEVVLSPTIVDAIADELSTHEQPTVADARGLAFDHLDRETEFRTEQGEPLLDVLEARLSN